RTTSVGPSARTCPNRAWMPASSLALTQRAPDGRTATSKVAFATSMPTNTAGSLISTSAPGVPSSWPSLATCGVVPRSTVRAPDEQWTTPQLKHGLEDQRQDELSPTVRSYVRSEHTSGRCRAAASGNVQCAAARRAVLVGGRKGGDGPTARPHASQ